MTAAGVASRSCPCVLITYPVYGTLSKLNYHLYCLNFQDLNRRAYQNLELYVYRGGKNKWTRDCISMAKDVQRDARLREATTTRQTLVAKGGGLCFGGARTKPIITDLFKCCSRTRDAANAQDSQITVPASDTGTEPASPNTTVFHDRSAEKHAIRVFWFKI